MKGLGRSRGSNDEERSPLDDGLGGRLGERLGGELGERLGEGGGRVAHRAAGRADVFISRTSTDARAWSMI